MHTVRNATVDDALAIQTIFYKTWLATYPNKKAGITVEDIEEMFKDSFSEEKINEWEERFNTIPTTSRLFVATEDTTDEIIGLARVHVREEYNQLQAIYVLPKFQGKGAGHALWNASLTFFDTSKDCIVQVATYNTQAIQFYESLGFVDTGKRFSEERHRMPFSQVLIPEMEMLRKVRPN